ncbi:flavin-containing monooxygenase [Rhodococcus gordoniae]|uniref:flavin-containing monooxygenase n=1 Tax=Rhodococcus gordoniae TaxID=223392 RepID=UPI00352468F2
MKSPANIEHLDVVIVGAGISGIAAAVELSRSCPDKKFAIVEMRSRLGGTWDLFRYPGIRSDSDMYTLGYSFKPWTASKAIASGEAIRHYLQETVDEYGLHERIRLETRLNKAVWSSEHTRWTLTLETPDGRRKVSADHIYLGAGYYSYSGGFDPALPGEDVFDGTIVHPQQWPEDLNYVGKRIAVIGSGATAVTLVPSMADDAQKVTMIQRSPTYLATEPDEDEEAEQLRAAIGPVEAFERIRLRKIDNQQTLYQRARVDAEGYKADLFAAIEEFVGSDIREKHFTPKYAPWDQRVCFVPDGDLFKSIRDGKAEVVTGTIERLTSAGVLMSDGEIIEADIIVKATGLNLTIGGDAEFCVDDRRVDFSETYTYKGMAYSNVPNLVFAFGFLNSSWTLRIELVNAFWIRVLQRMDDLGASSVTPRLRPEDESVEPEPFISDVNSGYFRRGLPKLPKQGKPPWINPQSYAATRALFDEDPQDGVLIFDK